MHSQIIWINDILHWISTCGHVGSINLQIKLCEGKIGKGPEVQVTLQYLHLHSVMHIPCHCTPYTQASYFIYWNQNAVVQG